LPPKLTPPVERRYGIAPCQSTSPRCDVLSFCVAILLASRVGADEKHKTLLKTWSIKYETDDVGNVISVELPPDAITKHADLLMPLHTIRTIRAPYCSLHPGAVKQFERLPNLTALYFDNAPRANSYAEAIRGCRNLDVLSFYGSGLQNSGLEVVCESHPELRELDISSRSISADFAIPQLLKLRKLETLRMIDIHGLGFSSRSTFVSEFEGLAHLPRLRSLETSGFPVLREQILPFANCIHLEELHVGGVEDLTEKPPKSLDDALGTLDLLFAGSDIYYSLGSNRLYDKGKTLHIRRASLVAK
jgi:hypothetical protein